MRVRRWSAVFVSASAIVGFGATSVAFAAPPLVRAAAPAPQTTLPGGDLQTLPAPRSVRSVASAGTGWASVPVVSRAALPADTVAAVVLAVTVRSAARSGTVLTRAHGNTGSGATALAYRASGAAGMTIVKVGRGGAIDVRTSGGSPKLGLKVVAWLPKTSSVDVPDTAPSAQSVQTSTTATRTLVMTGRAGIPLDAGPLFVAISSSGTKAGKYTAWRADKSRPSVGYAVPAGGDASLLVIRPGVGGKVAFRALAGAPKLTVRVLGWGRGTTTVHGLDRPAALASVSPGAVRKLVVAGTAGVPSSARGVAVALAAPKGAVVSLWSGATASGSPIYTARSVGGLLTAWVPVPSGRAVAVKVTGTKSKTGAAVHGYADTLGAQAAAYTAKPGTYLLASGDVLAQRAGSIDLAASAGPVVIGNYVMVRPLGRAAYVALVTGTAPRAGGGTTVSVQGAPLADAFSSYKAHYDGAVGGALTAAAPAGGARALADFSGPGGISLAFLSGEWWDCSVGTDLGDVLSITVDYSGSAYLDFSLADRTLDFSLHGRVSVTFTLKAGLSVSCSVTGELPYMIPLGATGLALKFGGTGELSASLPDDAPATVSLTGGISVFAGYGYFDGDATGTTTAHPFGSAQAEADGIELSLSLGVFVEVGLAVPPGEDDVINASASLTLGVEWRVGRPDPSKDVFLRELRGSHCLDVGLAPFVKFGADLVLPFFPDVSLDLAEFDGPEVPLYEGPCWGYSGTVTTKVQYTVDPADQSCSLQYCGLGTTINETMKKTLVPQVASFTHFTDAQIGQYGSPIVQPYNWAYQQTDVFNWEASPDPFGLDPPPFEPCSDTVTGTGSGSVGWDLDVPTTAWVLDGWQAGSMPWAHSGAPFSGLSLNHAVTGEENPCGHSWVEGTSPPGYSSNASSLMNLLDSPTINLTLTGNIENHPNWKWTTKVALTRADYPR